MEDVHTTEWARKIHPRKVWYCDVGINEYSEFASANDLETHIESEHPGAFSEDQLRRKLSRNVLPSPRKPNICPLCNQDVLRLNALQQKSTGQEENIKGKEKESEGHARGRKNLKLRFQDFDDFSSSDDETQASTPKTRVIDSREGLTLDEWKVVNRQKVSTHVAGHLKSLAFFSIRYLYDDEAAAAKSEDAAFGANEAGSNGDAVERFVDDFPEAEGLPVFEDIALNDRRDADEEEHTRVALLLQEKEEPAPLPLQASALPHGLPLTQAMSYNPIKMGDTGAVLDYPGLPSLMKPSGSRRAPKYKGKDRYIAIGIDFGTT